MPDSMLDPRSRVTTAAEREKLYALPNPVEGEAFAMMAETFPCCVCEKLLEPMDVAWLKPYGPETSEAKLAALDPSYIAGEPVLMCCCLSCARKELGPAMTQFLAERAQCEREERLEAAVNYESEHVPGTPLPVEHWFTIAEANLGYVAPELLPESMSALTADYSERFGVVDARSLEKVRVKLWAMTPAGAGLSGPRLNFVPQGTPEVHIEPVAGSPALAELRLKTLVKLEVKP